MADEIKKQFEGAQAENPLIAKYGAQKRWLLWRKELDKDGKPTKVPYQPNGVFAASTREREWCTAAEAQLAIGFDGIGIVFTGDKLVLGIDLDHIFEEGYETPPYALEFIQKANTYTEWSPSKTGLHAYLELTAPLDLIAHKKKIGAHHPDEGYECYTDKRFFTVTGEPYLETRPIRIATPQEAEELLKILGYPWKTTSKTDRSEGTTARQSNDDDTTLIQKMFGAANGTDILKLWQGDISKYNNDDSAADMALCCHLAFWTNKNKDQMARIWRSSPLGARAKTKDRDDYVQRTVERACETVQESYGDGGTNQKKIKKDKNPVPEPRIRIAKCPSSDNNVDFSDWRSTVAANFPDLLLPAETALAVLAQFLIRDITNPFALVFVDVPSSGKTIGINFFDGIPELTYATDKFTPASFVSNAANVKKEKLAEIDLLPRIQYRMLLIRDFATLFSKREEDLKEMLGILTRVLDGEGLNTDTGVHGQRQYNGEYLFMILAASTPIPYKVWKIMGNLGSRLFFMSINSCEKTEEQLAQQIRDTSYKEKEKICRTASKNFLYGLWNRYPDGIEWSRTGDDAELLKIIVRCAKLLARLRGTINVWHDDFLETDKYETPLIERPDRINQLFYNLVRGHALVSGRTQIERDDLMPIFALMLDSAPFMRANLFKALLGHGGTLRTSEIERDLNCSKPTALTRMKELTVLGIGTLCGESEKEIKLCGEFEWFLSDEFRELQRGGTR
jgi:hypothetical protein